MRIVQTDARLVLTDRPTALWALGLVFAASGLLVLSLPLWAAEWADFGLWARVGIIAIGVGHLGGGLYTAWQPQATEVEIDRARDIGHVVVRRFWPGGRGRARPFRPSTARAIELAASTDSDGDPIYRLRLWLEGSEALWLQAQANHGEGYLRARAETIAAFLGIGAPMLGQEDESLRGAPRAPQGQTPLPESGESAT